MIIAACGKSSYNNNYGGHNVYLRSGCAGEKRIIVVRYYVIIEGENDNRMDNNRTYAAPDNLYRNNNA